MALRVGDTFSFGSWPLAADGPQLPLEWVVLEVRPEGDVLATTRGIIECRPFHDVQDDITWQLCDLRYWLNVVFFQRAFSEDERVHVREVENATPNNEVFHTKGGGDADDKVFLLSVPEAQALFTSDGARAAVVTGYAKRGNHTSWWWLRSPGGHQFTCAAVSDQGVVDPNGFHVSLECMGVRPCMVVNLERACGSVDAPLQDERDYRSAADALLYGDAKAAAELLEKYPITRENAALAIAGGFPSHEAILSLVEDDLLSETELYFFCLAALHARAEGIGLRLLDASNRVLSRDRQAHLMKAAVESGVTSFVRKLMAQGVPSAGYARAYITPGAREQVAYCAALADPVGALTCWERAKKFPLVIKEILAFCQNDEVPGALQTLAFNAPDLLELLAQCGFNDFIRFLADRAEHVEALLTNECFVEAIEAAKLAGNKETVALLLDRQAARNGGQPEQPFGSALFL